METAKKSSTPKKSKGKKSTAIIGSSKLSKARSKETLNLTEKKDSAAKKSKGKKSAAITGSSKLSKAQSKETLNLIEKKDRNKIHSYRLYPVDENNLKTMLKAINKIRTGKVITETALIRGLISLGSKTKPEKILKALKEVL